MPELVLDLSALAGRWNRHADLEALVRAVPQVKTGGDAIVGPFLVQRSANLVEVMPHVPNEPQHGVVKLRRGECLVLPLVLKGRWYRMIESGEKREEYRDLTRYWHERLLRFNRELLHSGKKPVVEFRHGYAANDDILARFAGNPIRVLQKCGWGDPIAKNTYIGHFMEDRWMYCHDWIMAGILKESEAADA